MPKSDFGLVGETFVGGVLVYKISENFENLLES